METEQQVARHYSRSGIEQAVIEALRAAARMSDRLAPGDLSGADEFHLGWHAATAELARDLGLGPDLHVLDVGCGIGGPARHFAAALGCRVTGIDLTAEFVEAAEALTRRCGLAGLVSFRQGSALAMPFPDAEFDAATLIHVGMNIADKAALFAEVRRVLKPGARFGVYDIMRMAEGELPYPMPWAATPDTSFVEPPETYRRLLAEAGFAIEAEHDRSDLALRLGREMRERRGPRSFAARPAPPDGPSDAAAHRQRHGHAGARPDRAGRDGGAGGLRPGHIPPRAQAARTRRSITAAVSFSSRTNGTAQPQPASSNCASHSGRACSAARSKNRDPPISPRPPPIDSPSAKGCAVKGYRWTA